MSFWPQRQPNGYATEDVYLKPYKRVTASCFAPNIRTPLHTHPDHDQFIYVAHGELTVVTDQLCVKLLAGESRMIPSSVPHGFQTGNEECRIISAYLGELAEAPTLTDLPINISALLDPSMSSYETICTAITSPEIAAHSKGLSEREMETMHWVIDQLLHRIETGKTANTPHTKPKIKKPHLLRGWRKGETFFMKTHGMAICIMFHRGTTGGDHVVINEIQGIMTFETFDKIPRLC